MGPHALSGLSGHGAAGETVIVDTTCSTKRRWPVYADLRLDKDPAVKPDIVADTRRLPFADGTVDELWCDPPHLVKSHKNHSPHIDDEMYFGLSEASRRATAGYRRFSIWGSMAEYLSWLTDTSREFRRVLKPYGIVRYKTTDGSRSHGNTIRVADAITAFESAGFRLVLDDAAVSTGFFARWHAKHHGTTTYTHYLTFQARGVP